MKEKFLQKPTNPPEVKKSVRVDKLLRDMSQTGFQGRNLGLALAVWQDMLKDSTTIFLGLAGALVPAGLRKIISYLIRKRLIDCLVSTGANLFHDTHETLGRFHFQGTPDADDLTLRRNRIDRIYDIFAAEKEFCKTDEFIAAFTQRIDRSRPYSTREYLYLLGGHLAKVSKEEGILVSAFKEKVPVYCPALGDSSIGIALAVDKYRGRGTILFDILQDVVEMANIVMDSKSTGVIYLGGGTPKNFIQQAEITASFFKNLITGHKYAIQITADSPHWGGLSGCTFEEAQSWGKIARKARKVTVHCDVTIALPFLVSGLVNNLQARKKVPKFSTGPVLRVE